MLHDYSQDKYIYEGYQQTSPKFSNFKKGCPIKSLYFQQQTKNNNKLKTTKTHTHTHTHTHTTSDLF